MEKCKILLVNINNVCVNPLAVNCQTKICSSSTSSRTCNLFQLPKKDISKPLVHGVGEVPLQVGSPEGGSHKGVPNWWRTHKYENLHICKIFFFFFPPFFVSYFFEFSWSVPSKNLSMGTWECQNITGSPPPCRDLLLGRSLKIHREI